MNQIRTVTNIAKYWYLNTAVEVLVEDVNPKNPTEQVMGCNRQTRHVFFNGSIEEFTGRFVNVDVTEAMPSSLSGIIAWFAEVK